VIGPAVGSASLPRYVFAPHVLRSDVRFEEIDGNECYTLALVGTIPLEANEKEESHLRQPHRWLFAP